MKLSSIFHRLFGWRILTGPFSGMSYVGDYTGSLLAPKLLGTYEKELHSLVEQLIAAQPSLIVNVGGGEGYYAVGLARRLPRALIRAYEANVKGQELIAQVARQNGVSDRVMVGGLCSVADLNQALAPSGPRWLIIDVEGAEDFLLDLAAAPGLARTAILLEVHDFVDRTLGDRIKARFAATHSLTEIWSQPRTLADLPWWLRLVAITPWKARVVQAMDEQRPEPMRWFILIPLLA